MIGLSFTLVAARAGSLSPGVLGCAITFASSISYAFVALVRGFSNLENSMNSIERIKYYSETIDQESDIVIQPEVKPPQNWPTSINILLLLL